MSQNGKTTARCELSAGVLRRLAGRDSRRRLRAQQSRLHRAGHHARREQGYFGPVIEQTEGTKVWLRVMNELKGRGISDILIAVVDRLKLSRSYQCDVPADRGANLHRPSRSAFAGFCLLEGPQARRPPQDHLPRHRRRCWPGRNGTFARRAMGYKISAIARSWRRNWNLSSRFLRLPKRSHASSTPQTRSRRSIQNCVERFEQEATSQTMTPRQKCCIYVLTAQRLSGSDTARMVRGEDAIRHHVQRAFREL